MNGIGLEGDFKVYGSVKSADSLSFEGTETHQPHIHIAEILYCGVVKKPWVISTRPPRGGRAAKETVLSGSHVLQTHTCSVFVKKPRPVSLSRVCVCVCSLN